MKLRELQTRCTTVGEVKELFEAAKGEWEEERGTRVGLGKRLEGVLWDYVGDLEQERKKDKGRDRRRWKAVGEHDRGGSEVGGWIGARELDASKDRIRPLNVVSFSFLLLSPLKEAFL